MRKLFLISAPLLSLALAAPAFSQGATQSPPSPNSAASMPQSPNSLPPGARTLPPGTTGIQRTGEIATTRVGPAHTRHARRYRHHMETPAQETIPTPQSR